MNKISFDFNLSMRHLETKSAFDYILKTIEFMEEKVQDELNSLHNEFNKKEFENFENMN